jgi:hypothetical protein
MASLEREGTGNRRLWSDALRTPDGRNLRAKAFAGSNVGKTAGITSSVAGPLEPQDPHA